MLTDEQVRTDCLAPPVSLYGAPLRFADCFLRRYDGRTIGRITLTGYRVERGLWPSVNHGWRPLLFGVQGQRWKADAKLVEHTELREDPLEDPDTHFMAKATFWLRNIRPPE